MKEMSQFIQATLQVHEGDLGGHGHDLEIINWAELGLVGRKKISIKVLADLFR